VRNDSDTIELFLLKCASIKLAIEEKYPNPKVSLSIADEDASVKAFVSQFSAEVRNNALMMAEHYNYSTC
jgi:hypothetical protein